MQVEPTPSRPLQLLETLAAMSQPAALAEIAVRVGMHPSAAFRALKSLQEQGYVDHNGRSGYRLGSRSVALASLIGPRPALLQKARPVLRRLAALSSGAALSLRSGAHRVLVLGYAADPVTDVEFTPGERAPLTTGCTGTVILAHLPAAEADAVFASRPPGEPRPSAAELARIMRDGYATSYGRNHAGFHGIAAPLLDPESGVPLGSLAIAGTRERMTRTELMRLRAPLMAACAELSPGLARLLGPQASASYAALDVTIQDFLEG